jgi:hypothetical protein
MLNPVRSILGQLFRRPMKAPRDDEAVTLFRKTLGPCPVCSGPLREHAHWRLAAVTLDRPSDASRVTDLVATGRWEDAAREVRWAPDQDVREYHVIRCPIANGVGLVVVVFTHEFWSRDYVEVSRALSTADGERLNQLAEGRWRPL